MVHPGFIVHPSAQTSDAYLLLLTVSKKATMAVLRSQPSRGLAVWKTIFLIPIFLFTALTFWLMQSAAHQQNSTIDDDTATFFAPTVVVGIPRQRVIAKPDPFPPLEEVTELMKQIHNEVNRTAGQFILDFAILGFAKCGTSTMSEYIISNILPTRDRK